MVAKRKTPKLKRAGYRVTQHIYVYDCCTLSFTVGLGLQVRYPYGLNNSAVLENIEAYTTLIAILGGPALLIIKDALDVWKAGTSREDSLL